MKKVLLFIMTAIFLVGCNAEAEEQIHENVTEELAEDTREIISIVETIVTEEREYTQDEKDTISEYKEEHKDSLVAEYEMIYFLTTKMTSNIEHYQTVEGSLDNAKIAIENTIKHGKANPE